jgi:hypothetical protein
MLEIKTPNSNAMTRKNSGDGGRRSCLSGKVSALGR